MGRTAGHLPLCLALFLTSLAYASCEGLPSRIDELVSCINARSCESADGPVTWSYLHDQRKPCLTSARGWWSNKPALVPVVLVTQLSIDRLQQLKAQCSTWQGPLAAAIHVSIMGPADQVGSSGKVQQAVQNASTSVDQLFMQTEQLEGGCSLRIILLYTIYASQQAVTLYPVNTLRNYARLLADTELVAMFDVDMLPSLTLSADLSKPQVIARMSRDCSNKIMYIIPAFETACGGPGFADDISQLQGKRALKGLINKQCITTFGGKHLVYHAATDFARWFKTHKPYAAQVLNKVELFEPWVIGHRQLMPWHDVRYVGYGKNKVVQGAAARTAGFKYKVHPLGFLIHRAHEYTQAREGFLEAKRMVMESGSLGISSGVGTMGINRVAAIQQQQQQQQHSLFAHIEALWAADRAAMMSNSYSVVVDDTLLQCAASLSWWRQQ